jgi:hypothetical protein
MICNQFALVVNLQKKYYELTFKIAQSPDPGPTTKAPGSFKSLFCLNLREKLLCNFIQLKRGTVIFCIVKVISPTNILKINEPLKVPTSVGEPPIPEAAIFHGLEVKSGQSTHSTWTFWKSCNALRCSLVHIPCSKILVLISQFFQGQEKKGLLHRFLSFVPSFCFKTFVQIQILLFTIFSIHLPERIQIL